MTPSSDTSMPSSVEAQPLGVDHDLHPSRDLMDYLREYAKEKPEVVAMCCFGLGFIVGWRLKPW